MSGISREETLMDKPKMYMYEYTNHAMPLAVQLAMETGMWSFPKRRKRPKQKKCLQCGEMHEHNNVFCSAECCRLYYKETHR